MIRLDRIAANALLALILLPTGVMAEVAWPGQIIFAARSGKSFDLFSWEPASGKLLALAATSLDERAPAVAPDHSRVAYVTSDGAIHVLPLAGGEAERLPLPEGRYGNPAWLAHGTGLVVTSYSFGEHGEDADLLTYDFKTGRSRPLLIQPGIQDQASLSADGAQLAWASGGALTLAGFGFQVHQSLWHAALETGTVRQLLMTPEVDSEPSFSPDGKQIAFVSDRAGSQDIWLCNADGSNPVPLTDTPGAELHPAWSPDGKAIVFVARNAEGSRLEILAIADRLRTVLKPFADTTIPIMEPDWQ